MENRDRLDEFLQRKFVEDKPEQRIPFREEHWLQAQAMLDARTKRRRWRRFVWWLGAGILVLLAGWWWQTLDGPPAALLSDGPGIVPESAVQPPPNTIPKPSTEKKHPGYSLSPPISEDRFLPEIQGEGSSNSPEPKKKDRMASGSNIGKAVPGPINRPIDPEAATAGNFTVNPAASSDQPETGSQTALAGATASVSGARASSFAALALLPLRGQAATLRPSAKAMPDGSVFKAEELPVERRRGWRRQAGVMAAASSSLGHLEREASGAGAGLSLRLNKRSTPWSFSADIFWRWRSGTLSDPLLGATEQLRYGLGFTLERYEHRVQGTHWLELPVYVQYRLGVVNIEAGAMPSLMLMVQGREQHTRQTSLTLDGNVVENRRIQLENRYFKSLHGSVFTGVEWAATDRLHLGLRLHYQPGDLRKNPDYGIADRSPVWADLRVRFFYWNKNN